MVLLSWLVKLDNRRSWQKRLRVGGQPVDSGALLVHARVTGIRREGVRIIAELELPESFQ